MDFLKTLLAYMALLTTLSVQEGPNPQAVPTPTLLPPSVTATLVPHMTEAPTATPAPTPVPAPTITPNLRYETVKYQDRGAAVRKLQNRLIELGYMPAGSADSAYGYQTYNAVRDFQRANGLDADGVAGPATLTNLYENPNVLPKTTPTVAPTATPTPTLPPLPTMVSVTPVPATTTPSVVGEIALPEVPGTAERPALTEILEAFIISGNTGRALAITRTLDGVAVNLRPSLWTDAYGAAYVSLRELVDCYDGWSLMGSSADGVYTLQAAGYVVTMHLAGDSVTVISDGKTLPLTGADVWMNAMGEIIVRDTFIEKALDANVIFDVEERSLVLFIMDKSISQAHD